jgi:hypothetical protein
MLQVSRTIEVNVPLEVAWTRITKLDDVSEWSDDVLEAHYRTETQQGVGAARLCEVRGVGQLDEEVVEWEEQAKMTLRIKGMPAIVREALGTWALEKVTANRTRVTTTMSIQTAFGPLGWLVENLALRSKLDTSLSHLQAGFKTFAEEPPTTVERSLKEAS